MPSESEVGERWRLTVRGVVQGVGFRPFVWRLAVSLGLAGWVLNDGHGVVIEAEGSRGSLEAFARDLRQRAPRLARVEEVTVERLAVGAGATLPAGDFRIVESRGEAAGVLIPPDLATCPDCRRDIGDPASRYWRYPFTNCTACGPRFTVVTGLPYDRSRTTLASFPMCEDCRREYEDPADRRFHAQPTACPACGPRAWVTDAAGRQIPGSWEVVARELLRAGRILAVKGMGGYHLACDATREEAVARLRQRKARPAKPFAVMFPDLEAVRLHCLVSLPEEELLTDPRSPIVILRRRPGSTLAPSVAPGLDTVGVMLPYTPLHLLLLEGSPPLVMTSGNRGGLPIVKDEEEAFAQLGGLADCFLVHNRPIFRRCDDSVARVIYLGGRAYSQIVRRSRGYVPEAISLPLPPEARGGSLPPVAALGAEMKNVVCLTRGREAFLSQHLGEMDTEEGVENLREALRGMSALLGVEPEAVAYDLHPHFSLTGLAAHFPPERQVRVQHHHAHLAAVLAEAGRPGPVVGIVADGVGYGLDGQVWGLEILVASLGGFRRAAHLAYAPLPGGEGAIRHPLRMAVAYLRQALGEEGWETALSLFPEQEREVRVTWQLAGRPGLLCSSAGRLFDAVAALLGICYRNTYEGQAAVELEEEAWRSGGPERFREVIRRRGAGRGGARSAPGGAGAGESGLPWLLRREGEEGSLDPAPLVATLAEEVRRGRGCGRKEDWIRRRSELAALFHLAVAEMMAAAAVQVAAREGLDTVALSGGTFQNAYLLPLVVELLEREGLRCLLPRRVPVNDGGLALGQTAVAVWKLAAAELS